MQNSIEIQKYDKQLMSIIGKSSEIVRGKLDLTSSVYTIIVFTVLRRIDCYIGTYSKEMSQKYVEFHDMPEEFITKEMRKISSSRFYNVSGMNLADVVSYPDKIEFYLTSYVNGFNKEVKELLDMFDVNALIAKLNHEKVIYDLVNYFSSIDLGSSVTSIEICKVFRNALEKRSEFSTPLLYCYYAQAMLFGKEVQNDNVKIYDPVCGVGNLLNAVAFNAFSLYQGKNVTIYGQDVSRYDVAIMSACAFLIGQSPQNIKLGNVITEDLHSNKKFDYIVADLPLGMPWQNYANEIYHESIDGRFKWGVPKQDSQLLFIQHVISKMSPTGSRAVIITNSNPLSGGDNNDSNIRKSIIENDLLETIIALPKANGQNIKRYMWVLSNNKAENRRGRIHLIDANLMRDKEKCNIADDELSLLNVVNQFYDSDFPEPYNKYVSLKDLGWYQISIKDKKEKKIIKMEVPLTENPDLYLEKRGISPKFSERFEILYDRTIDLYKIDMEKIFSQKEDLVASEDKFSEVQQSLMAVYHFEAHLDSMPKLTPATDKQMVNEGIFKEVPSHWNGFFLRDVVTCKMGKKYKDKDKEVKSIPVYSISDLRNNDSNSSYTNDMSAVMMHDNDVIVISKGANAGNIVIGKDGALGQNMILVEGDTNFIHKDYLYFLISALDLNSKATGTAIKGVSIQDITDTFVSLPSIEEQEKMVEYMYSLESSIIGLYQSFDVVIPVIETYWKSLMTEIVTGKFDFRTIQM